MTATADRAHEALMARLPDVVARLLAGDREPAARFAAELKATPDDGRQWLVLAAFAEMLLDSGRVVASSLAPSLRRASAGCAAVFAPLLMRAEA